MILREVRYKTSVHVRYKLYHIILPIVIEGQVFGKIRLVPGSAVRSVAFVDGWQLNKSHFYLGICGNDCLTNDWEFTSLVYPNPLFVVYPNTKKLPIILLRHFAEKSILF